MTHSTQLAAKVAARNDVHAQILRDAPTYLAALAPFVGKKIHKATGDFTKAFLDAMPKAGNYWISSQYSLARSFRATAEGRHTAYQDASLYLGEVSNGVLVKLCDFTPANFRTDYDAATIAGARLDVSAKRRALQEAESALSFFGEHDNN